MSHSAMPASPARFCSEGSYRTNMTALGVRPGVLTLDGECLSFVGADGEVFFDGPVGTFHSVGLAEMNETLEIWQGGTRHRVSLVAGGPYIGTMRGEFESDTVARRWQQYLMPLVGQVPAGVKVRKPVSKGLQLTLTLVFALLVVLAVMVAVFVIA